MYRTNSTIIKILLLYFCIISGWNNQAKAQTKDFSLEEAIRYGVENQVTIQRSKLDIELYNQKFFEGLSYYLPQAAAVGSFNDNLKLPTSLIPGEMFGQPGRMIEVQFGTKYTLSGMIDVSQTLVDASQIVGLLAAKEAQKIGLLNVKKSEEQVMYDVANAYFSAQITTIQKGILDANLQKLDSLIYITEAMVDNGFAKKLDLNRLKVSKTNLQTDLQNIDVGYQQQLLVLKYYMGYPLDSTIRLTTTMTDNISLIEHPVSGTNIPSLDIELLNAQKRLNVINLQQLTVAYLPTLSLSFRYGVQAQQDYSNFLDANTKWFPNSVIGLNLVVPLFDGLNKHSKMQQIKIQQKQLDLDIRKVQETVDMQYRNALLGLKTNQSAILVQQNNVKMAEEIYATTQYQYQAGFAPMSDLLNAETALKEAQTNYLQALAKVKLSELEVLKSSGNIHLIMK